MTLAPSTLEFDWYQASVELAPAKLEQLIGPILANEPSQLTVGRHGFTSGTSLRRDDRTVATMWHGGVNTDPLVFSTGDDAPALASAIRGLDLPHRVSRADVALDLDIPGAWELLSAELRQLAVTSGIDLRQVEDPERPERGRTLYVGSRRSEAMVRLYEKGRKDDPTRPDWVRFEVELKPQHRERKAHLATLSPVDALGLSRWVRAFVAQQFDITSATAPPRAERLGDDDRAMAAMLKQYGAILERQAARAGGWPQLGDDLGRRWRTT